MPNVAISNLSTTWNAGGTTFTAIKMNVTDTASAAASLLMDLQVGGTSAFQVGKDGTARIQGGGNRGFRGYGGSTGGLIINGSAILTCENGQVSFAGAVLNNTGAVNFSTDVTLARDAADTLAQRRTTSAQTFRLYNTFTDASNYERGKVEWASNVLRIGTEKAGTGSARALELQMDGTTRMSIQTDRLVVTPTTNARYALFDNGMAIGSGTPINWATTTTIGGAVVPDARIGRGGAAGVIYMDDASSGFNRLCFGGTTSTYPSIKRSSTTLIVRLADDSANAPLESASVKTDAPAGGTSGTWKLGVAATVTPTSPNRTIEVDIGGTIYYIHAKTTND